MTNPQTQSDDDVLWQAFLYVQGDLSANDAEAFEQQMLHDPRLCERVAEVSLLSSAVVRCKSDTKIVRDRAAGHSTRLRGLAVTVAGCCCAALIMFVSGRSVESPTSNANTSASTEASLLVAAWIENADGDEETDDDNSDLAFDSDLEIPEWMMAGIGDSDSIHDRSGVRQPDSDHPNVL